MSWEEKIKQWGTAFKEKRRERKKSNLKKSSCEVFNVKEFGGKIWLTHNGCLVCPSSMLEDDIVKSVEKMRELFVTRNM